MSGSFTIDFSTPTSTPNKKKTPFILYDKGVKVYCTRSEGNKYTRDEKPWSLVQTKMTSSVIFLTFLSVFDFVDKSYSL
jgi:hypothetical protein